MGNVIAGLLAVVFFCIGMTLTPRDFFRAFSYGWAFVYSATCQYILFPLICFFVCRLFRLSPEATLGIMLISFAPGATTATIYTFMFKGDTAFSVSSTALSFVIAPLTIPLLTEFTANQLFGDSKQIDLPFVQTAGQLLLSSVVPVILGMIVRKINLRFAVSSKMAGQKISGLAISLIVFGTVMQTRKQIAGAFQESGLAAITLCIIAIMLGYAARYLKISERQARTISFEVCLQNAAFSILICFNVLKMPAVFAGIGAYALLMFATGYFWGYYLEKKRPINKFLA
jgi:bile acid:Na+ symporter, BASS family